MKQELSQAISNSAATLLVGSASATGVLDYFGNNAAGIGAMCTLGFGFVYLYFQWSTNNKLSVAEVNAATIECLTDGLEELDASTSSRFDIIKEEFKSTNIKLDLIIKKQG